MDTHTIMYIGLQEGSPVRDRPNARPDREWNGAGSVVTDIPTIQASKLLSHPKEFEDVTKLVAIDLTKRAAAAKAEAQQRIREANRGSGEGVQVQTATTAELQAELARRATDEEDIEAAASLTEAPEIATAHKTRGDGATASADEQFVVEKVQASIEAIMVRENNDDVLDENGFPTLEAVQEDVGFSLTQEEYIQIRDRQ